MRGRAIVGDYDVPLEVEGPTAQPIAEESPRPEIGGVPLEGDREARREDPLQIGRPVEEREDLVDRSANELSSLDDGDHGFRLRHAAILKCGGGRIKAVLLERGARGASPAKSEASTF
jgi:hypothetical protein